MLEDETCHQFYRRKAAVYGRKTIFAVYLYPNSSTDDQGNESGNVRLMHHINKVKR